MDSSFHRAVNFTVLILVYITEYNPLLPCFDRYRTTRFKGLKQDLTAQSFWHPFDDTNMHLRHFLAVATLLAAVGRAQGSTCAVVAEYQPIVFICSGQTTTTTNVQ